MYNLSASQTFVYFFDYGVCLFNLFIQFTCVALQFINPSSALATLLPMSFKVVSILSSLLSWVIILSSLPSATSSAMCRARKTSSSSLSFERFPSGELDSAGTSTLYTSFRLTDRKMSAKGENLIYAIEKNGNVSGAPTNMSTPFSSQSQCSTFFFLFPSISVRECRALTPYVTQICMY